MNLTTTTYYSIQRSEPERREQAYDRTFVLALRWQPLREFHPENEGLDSDWVAAGTRHLDRLKSGDEISERHLNLALDYLDAALAYYERITYEPYPGRNAEAAGNLRDLIHELDRS